MNDLKRCPFCGSKAQLLIVPGHVAHWVVKCSKGCCNTCWHISDHDAEEAWNKRTAEEIIMCKDCKHHRKDTCSAGAGMAFPPPDDWFCGDGERR